MSRSLVLLARGETIDLIKDDLDELGRELGACGDLMGITNVYLIIATTEALRGTDADGGQPYVQGTQWMSRQSSLAKLRGAANVYVPHEICTQPQQELDVSTLGHYLYAPLYSSIIESKSPMETLFLWRPTWLEAMLACAPLVSALRAVNFLAPNVEKIWPTLPDGIRSHDMLHPQASADGLGRLQGESTVMRRLRREIQDVARYTVPVQLVGETGTGKELCAQALHELSGRRGNLLSVNCALLSPEHAESTLFGHVKGAFTGAEGDRAGRIREADKGTLFLDEFLDLPKTVQSQMLRATNAVEEAQLRIEPMGAKIGKFVTCDVRVITAIHPDAARRHDVRVDLLHRLAWVQIRVPPLREREEDAWFLAERYLAHLNQVHGPARVSSSTPSSHDVRFGPDARRALESGTAHDWPGNVRELRVVTFRAWLKAVSSGRSEVSLADLTGSINRDDVVAPRPTGDLRVDIARHVVSVANDVRDRFGGSMAKAARALGWHGANEGQAFKKYVDRHRRVLESVGQDQDSADDDANDEVADD